jgi:hypothetical protein
MKSKRSSPKFSSNSIGILSNKYVLYASFFFAIVTAANYLLRNNLEAVAIFIIIGFLTTYFSKNMIIVLLTTTILTNFIVMYRNRSYSMMEGFTTAEIAILKSAADQISEQAIHVDFDPRKKSSSDAFSTIIPLNDYCVVNIQSTGCPKMQLHVNTGFMLQFTSKQPHGGGTNRCGKDQYRVHAYFYTGDSLPKNKVFAVIQK